MSTYIPPELRDYGSVAELTEFQGFFGPEDGATKAVPVHHEPNPPSTPSS